MTIPPDILKSLDVGMSDQLILNVQESVLTATPVMSASRKQYKLADLLTQCDKNAPVNAEMTAWDNMRPLGSELT
jgi:antitoxin component of MazEF toxin-antitoxin module